MTKPKSERLQVRVGRIRTIKPEFFTHEDLFDLEQKTGLPVRLAYAGLWTQCDREGRFPWRPRTLKNYILPYDDIEFSRVLDALVSGRFIIRYETELDGETRTFGAIPKWHLHQNINNREQKSIIPPPTADGMDRTETPSLFPDASATRESRVNHASATLGPAGRGEGKGREGNRTTKPNGLVAGAVPAAPASAAQVSAEGVTLKLQAGKTFRLEAEVVAKLIPLYPHVDVPEAVRRMVVWCENNPQKRKTAQGIMKFVTNWLAKDQKESFERAKADGDPEKWAERNSFAYRAFCRELEHLVHASEGVWNVDPRQRVSVAAQRSGVPDKIAFALAGV